MYLKSKIDFLGGYIKKFKKFLVIALSVVTAFSFSACDKDDSDDKKTETTSAEEKDTTAEDNETTTEDNNAVTEDVTKDTGNKSGVAVYEGTGYTLTLPEKWVQTTNSSTDLIFADQDSPNADFASTINVVIEDCSSYDTIKTAEDYMEAALQQFENNDYFEVTNTDQGTCNGYDVAIVNLDATNGTTQYKCEQYYFVEDQIAYVLTFSGDLNGGYEDTLEEAESIFETFTLD